MEDITLPPRARKPAMTFDKCAAATVVGLNPTPSLDRVVPLDTGSFVSMVTKGCVGGRLRRGSVKAGRAVGRREGWWGRREGGVSEVGRGSHAACGMGGGGNKGG